MATGDCPGRSRAKRPFFSVMSVPASAGGRVKEGSGKGFGAAAEGVCRTSRDASSRRTARTANVPRRSAHASGKTAQSLTKRAASGVLTTTSLRRAQGRGKRDSVAPCADRASPCCGSESRSVRTRASVVGCWLTT